ncbi:MAG TPA: phage tail protein [Vicinamibacterales bacterium]
MIAVTTAPSRLLPASAPPHDPYSVMLAGHIGDTPGIGWRVRRLAGVDIDLASKALVLSPAPAAARWLSEPGGSFGGLRPPSHVTVTARGDVLLLDPATGEIRRFDPCACHFVAVPCVARLVEPRECDEPDGGPTFPPRDRLNDPRGIAACGSDLYIADRGHHRVVRYALGTWVPRGVIRLPHAERLAMGGAPWQPTGLAFDGSGHLLVTDETNGRLDRFSPRGRWMNSVPVEIGATHIAVDCHDRIYVVIEQARLSAVPASAAAVTIEIDGGTAGFHWHTLQLSPLGVSARGAVDVHAGDDGWTAAYRNDPANPEWQRWLDADGVRRALTPLPLGGRAGRYLRIRFSPAPGHVPAPFDASARGARVLRVTGTTVEVVHGARADLVGGFGCPPVVVDQEGRLHLTCEDGVRVFDERGEPYTGDPSRGERFEREGRFYSTVIDSQIEACLWHRIELRGAIPAGCSVEVLTATSEIELTPWELESLPAAAWTGREPARAMEKSSTRPGAFCSWDALIDGQPGRYLWVQLVLRGDGQQTPCVSSAIVEYPRISLRRYLPGVFGVDPAGADFTDRFTAIFDRTLRSIETHLDHLPLYFDPASAPARAPSGQQDFLSWLGEWIGITLAREWPEARRRRYVKEAARLYCRRGTTEGLRAQLLLLLGFDVAYGERCLAERPQCRCTPNPRNCGPCPKCEPAEPPPLLLEHFKLRRWLYAGHGRLGSDSELWGKRIVGRSELSGDVPPVTGNAQIGVTALNTVPDPLRDPFHRYAHKFSVFVPSCVRDRPAERRALERLVALESPAHTQADIRYVEPRFRVGVQATLGLDSVVARTPRGVTLDRSRLRQGTVLTGSPSAPHLEVGNTRIGTTTRLT